LTEGRGLRHLDFHPAKGFTYGNSISERCKLTNTFSMFSVGGITGSVRVSEKMDWSDACEIAEIS
jgi:hypothetical protein